MDYYNLKQFIDDNLKLIFGKFIDIDIFLGKYRYMPFETLKKKCEDFANNGYEKHFFLALGSLVEKVMDNLANAEKENRELKEENERLKKENDEMKLHISLSPEGTVYLETKEHYESLIKNDKN